MKMLSVVGISVGTLIHVVAAALGFSAILVSSAAAFTVVKYLGAIYLLYLGVRELISKKEIKEEKHVVQKENLKKVFYEGALVNLLNPK